MVIENHTYRTKRVACHDAYKYKGAYTEWLDIGPLFQKNQSRYINETYGCGFRLWMIQPDVVNIQRARATGRCTAFAAQTDCNLIHVCQIDPLIGNSL